MKDHCVTLLVSAFLCHVAYAQEDPPAYQSGYEDVPKFGGPECVTTEQLKQNGIDREGTYQFDTLHGLRGILTL